RRVVALAAGRRVLVHAEAGEVERLAVDQEPLPVDGDGADPDRLRVGVDERALLVEELDAELVQVALTGLPRVGALDPEASFRPLGRRHLLAVGVAEDRANLMPPSAADLDRVVDDAGGAVERRLDRDRTDVRGGRRVQPDAPVEAGEVEEVVKVLLPAAAVLELLDVTGRDRLPAQLVVDGDRD